MNKWKENLAIEQGDHYLFGQGVHYDIYKKLGAHKVVQNGVEGVFFAVWAPNAKYVSVIGDFNGWNGYDGVMQRQDPLGIWTLFVPGVQLGMMYKFQITTQQHVVLDKADPFANFAERRPGTASVVTDLTTYVWGDDEWLKERGKRDNEKDAMSIYEVHPGSWKKHPTNGDDKDGFYNYKELAHSLCEYVKNMGYTHIELMGIAEHPYDGSWGYQVTGYYAPTSRYGTPQDFMYFVDYMHQNGIGVLLDWVPAHFPRDAHGLACFDGTAVYEYADPRKGEHPDWGTKIFDYGKNEVRNFLIANAIFWVEEFHIDGLRVDAVASMLYLDYGKQDGQWVRNQYGENKNLEAIEFFRHLNSLMLGRYPGIAMIAEESTAWPQVTGKAEDGGLGFSLKWYMGWMHDFLDYMKLDPYFRKDNHNRLTFAMTYQCSENYINVISHDEVVHLKCSMLYKMPGTLDEKFENLKAAYAYMFMHPGKKLLFMGQEFAQIREWSEKRELDWNLLEDPKHAGMQRFIKQLLHLYKRYPALHELDCSYEGFEWVNADDNSRSIYSFMRKSADGRNSILVVCNFTPVEYPQYRVGVPFKRKYKLLLNSADASYGGNGKKRKEIYTAEKKAADGHEYSIAYPLPAFGAAVFIF